MIRYRISLDLQALLTPDGPANTHLRCRLHLDSLQIQPECHRAIASVLEDGNDIVCLADTSQSASQSSLRSRLQETGLHGVRLEFFSNTKKPFFPQYRPHVHIDITRSAALEAVFAHVPLVFSVSTGSIPHSAHAAIRFVPTVADALAAFTRECSSVQGMTKNVSGRQNHLPIVQASS